MLVYSVVILLIYIFIYAFNLISRDNNKRTVKFVFASIIIIPFWILLIYQDVFFIIDKNGNNPFLIKQKIVIKNNSDKIIKYLFYIQDYNKNWIYYYPVETTLSDYKCYLPLIEQKPFSVNSFTVKTSNKTKFILQRVLPNKKNEVLIFDIPDNTLFVYNDDIAFRNIFFNTNKNKEFIFIISNFTALIASFLHIFKRPKKKFMSILTIFLSIVLILLTALFLINFIYLLLL